MLSASTSHLNVLVEFHQLRLPMESPHLAHTGSVRNSKLREGDGRRSREAGNETSYTDTYIQQNKNNIVDKWDFAFESTTAVA